MYQCSNYIHFIWFVRLKINFNMPAGSYANLGGTCFQEIKTTKSDLRPNKLKLTITRDYWLLKLNKGLKTFTTYGRFWLMDDSFTVKMTGWLSSAMIRQTVSNSSLSCRIKSTRNISIVIQDLKRKKETETSESKSECLNKKAIVA